MPVLCYIQPNTPKSNNGYVIYLKYFVFKQTPPLLEVVDVEVVVAAAVVAVVVVETTTE